MSTSVMEHCVYCGPYSIHIGLCPRIKTVEYHPNGMVKRIEFHDEYHEWNDDGEPVG